VGLLRALIARVDMCDLAHEAGERHVRKRESDPE